MMTLSADKNMATEMPNQQFANFWEAAISIKSRVGISLLSDNDMLVLAAEAIATSSTFAEKNYHIASSHE
jgi:uncharacterized protein (DUF2345 family)